MQLNKGKEMKYDLNELEKAQLEEIKRKRRSDEMGGFLILTFMLMFFALGLVVSIMSFFN